MSTIFVSIFLLSPYSVVASFLDNEQYCRNSDLRFFLNRCDIAGVKESLENGAKPDLIDYRWWQATVNESDPKKCADIDEMKRLLLQHGANPKRNYKSSVALVEAAAWGNLIQVCSLLKAGTNPNCIDKEGDTPLIVACKGNFLSVAQLLVEYYAMVNVRDAGGDTPLLCAIDNDNYKIVKFLLEHGATVNNSDEDTIPLALAVEYSTSKITALLLRYGASINVENQDGYTPFECAAKYDPKKIPLFFNHIEMANGSEKDLVVTSVGAAQVLVEYGYSIKHIASHVRQNYINELCAAFNKRKKAMHFLFDGFHLPVVLQSLIGNFACNDVDTA